MFSVRVMREDMTAVFLHHSHLFLDVMEQLRKTREYFDVQTIASAMQELMGDVQ